MSAFGSGQDTQPLIRHTEKVGWAYVPITNALSLQKSEGNRRQEV